MPGRLISDQRTGDRSLAEEDPGLEPAGKAQSSGYGCATAISRPKKSGIVYITGKVTVDLDGKFYTHSDLGRCIFTGDTPEALDMALAGSVTDCLKRCFRQLGEQFGNALYDKEIAQSAGLEQGSRERFWQFWLCSFRHYRSRPASAAPAAPTPPLCASMAMASSVNGNVSEQEAFDHYKKTTAQSPASKEALRTWLPAPTDRNSATVAA